MSFIFGDSGKLRAVNTDRQEANGWGGGRSLDRYEFWIPIASALLFTVSTIVALMFVDILDDEGLKEWVVAKLFLQEPLHVFFWQKGRVVGALLSLPGVVLGLKAWYVWYKILAGLTIFLLSRSVSAMGGRGAVVALILATSPLVIFSAMRNHSSIGAAFIVSLSLYLYYCKHRSFLAGLILTSVVWSRPEFTPAVGIIIAATYWKRRDLRFVLGTLVFPLAYAVGGAIYHQDILWWYHFQIDLIKPDKISETHGYTGVQFEFSYISKLLGHLFLVTPAWLLVFAPGRGGKGSFRREWMLILLVMATLMTMLPFFRMWHFSHSLRFWMVVLIPLSIVLSFGSVSGFTPLRRRLTVVLAALGMMLAFGGGVELSSWGMAASFAALLVIALFGVRPWPRRLGIALLAAASVTVALVVPAADEDQRHQHFDELKALEYTTDHIKQNPDIDRVFSDIHEFSFLKQLYYPNSLKEIDFIFLPPYDLGYEIYNTSNKKNGQFFKLANACRSGLYGHAMWPCDMKAQTSFKDSVFVLKNRPPSVYIYSHEYWDRISVPLKRFGKISVRVGKKQLSPPAVPEERIRLDDESLLAPCRFEKCQ